MNPETRKFKVFNKNTGERSDIQGVEALTKLLDLPLEGFPKIYITKGTFGHLVVYEYTSQK